MKKLIKNTLHTYVYWKIPTKYSHLVIALKKLNKLQGCDIEKNDLYSISGRALFNDSKYIYILNEFTGTSNQWYWANDSKFKYHHKYIGEIGITKEDLDNYYTEIEAEKYNL